MRLLLDLPDDALVEICIRGSVSARDTVDLAATCRRLRDLCATRHDLYRRILENIVSETFRIRTKAVLDMPPRRGFRVEVEQLESEAPLPHENLASLESLLSASPRRGSDHVLSRESDDDGGVVQCSCLRGMNAGVLRTKALTLERYIQLVGYWRADLKPRGKLLRVWFDRRTMDIQGEHLRVFAERRPDHTLEEQPVSFSAQPVFTIRAHLSSCALLRARGCLDPQEAKEGGDHVCVPQIDVYSPPHRMEVKAFPVREVIRLFDSPNKNEFEVLQRTPSLGTGSSENDDEYAAEMFDTEAGVTERFVRFIWQGVAPPEVWRSDAKYFRIPHDATSQVDSCDPCGVFYAHYGAHGPEFVHVRETQDVVSRRWFEGVKITGDPNVPCGEISFRVSTEPIRLFDLSPAVRERFSDVVGETPALDVGFLVHEGTARSSRHGYVSPRDSRAWMLRSQTSGDSFSVLFSTSGSFSIRFHRVTLSSIPRARRP